MNRLLPILAAISVATPALSDEPGTTGIVSEVKLGVSAHDLRIVAADPKEDGVDINAEVLFTSPSFLEPVFAPRPHIGAQVNTSGDTSQVYAGLTWTGDITDRFWVAGSVGGAYLNGEVDNPYLSRKALGSDVLFRLSAEAGVNLTERTSVSVYWDHESNAFLADRNPGLDNVGVRVGYKF